MKNVSGEKGSVLSECLEKSQGGLWVKGVRTQESIEVFWRPRFRYEGNRVMVFDFNGEIESEVPAARVDWGEEWRSAGVINIADEMVVMSGLEHFEAFANALMRHAVRLVVCGYGDSPADVVGWFFDFGARDFIVEGSYKIVSEHGEFNNLMGASVVVDRSDNGSLSAVIGLRGVEFEIGLDDPEVFTSFVIATVPA